VGADVGGRRAEAGDEFYVGKDRGFFVDAGWEDVFVGEGGPDEGCGVDQWREVSGGVQGKMEGEKRKAWKGKSSTVEQ
jgi:hypothetical protein